eukprot:853666-Pleurochrysis_carterae.AAC.2
MSKQQRRASAFEQALCRCTGVCESELRSLYIKTKGQKLRNILPTLSMSCPASATPAAMLSVQFSLTENAL